MYSDTKQLLLPNNRPLKLPTKPERRRARRGELAFVADAIRKGIEIFPKWIKGREFDGDGACAWGAALAGGVAVNQGYIQIAHPLEPEYIDDLRDVIVTLNDEDEWDRDKIARWLDHAKPCKTP